MWRQVTQLYCVGCVKWVMAEGWLHVQYICKVKWTASPSAYSDNENMDYVHNDAVMLVLREPTTTGKTERAIKRAAFAVNVSHYSANLLWVVEHYNVSVRGGTMYDILTFYSLFVLNISILGNMRINVGLSSDNCWIIAFCKGLYFS